MIGKLVLSVCLGLLLAPAEADAGRLSGERSLNTKPHGLTIVDAPVRAGRQAQRFEVRAGDCGRDSGWDDCATNRERSEFTLGKSFQYGSDQWIGFSVWLPPDFRASSKVNTTVGQIHQRGGPGGTAGGFASFPPLVQLEMRGDRYKATVHVLSGSAANVRDDVKEFTLAPIKAMRGKWTDVVLHLDTASGADLLEVFINGKRQAKLSGFIAFQPKNYYVKYGIYRSFVSRHGGPMPTQVVVIDEVKMGRSLAEVSVDPQRPVD
ncbi:hypothetical protein CXZ10_20075 [Pleomorphomonas diazotrophica]|uniref:Polysaccharide lyase n=1 Tax=Pleomorphomonas diazotrophica TaxID=1166257 RepID=A0A1I4V919_9HYPH|nr:heparin lyase I family protein [Pleomorphomonas diazotrophica]PKR87349.1 hypothetical protein CXZ10_20075 [Pleomorphomonas diazotrophica]SFM97663.1 Polysaccharide lyase [Pleomorphomonas diazotrophica]